MNSKGIAPIAIILIIIGILVLAGGGFYYYKTKIENQPKACTLEAKICPDGTSVGRTGPNCEFASCPGETEESEKEAACINSGGTVSISLCCKAVGDFPNLCPVGPCGCAPEYSHEVKICECPKNFCFNGKTCTSSLYPPYSH